MSSPTDESKSQRTGHRQLRSALIACFVAFCLAVLYVLLSAPLLLYAAHHWGSSSANMVEAYMQPLLWTEERLTSDSEAADAEHKEPLYTRALYWYYSRWSSRVSEYYTILRLQRYLKSVRESMEESTPIPGIDGPDSGDLPGP